MLVPFYDNNKSLDYTYENNPYKWIDLGVYLKVINKEVIKDFWSLDAFNLPDQIKKYEKLFEKYPPVNIEGDYFVSFKKFLISAKLLYNTGFLCKYWFWEKWKWTHLWIDLAMPSNTPIVSFSEWVVLFAWEKKWWWKCVVILQDDKVFSYSHLNKVLVKEKQVVKNWQKIWLCGNTGISTWYHLHFQIDKKQAPFHPYWWKKMDDIEKYCIDWWEWLQKNYKVSSKNVDSVGNIDKQNNLDNLDNKKTSVSIPEKQVETTKSDNESNLLDSLLTDLKVSKKIDYVQAFKNAGIIKNTNMKLPLTRYQFTLILYRMFKAGLLKLEKSKCNKVFSDVKNLDEEFLAALDIVCWNWILKWDKDKFLPWNFVSWKQFLATIGRLFWKLSDWKETNWWKPYYNWAIKNNIIDNNWKYLNTVVPRKEVVRILWKLVFSNDNLA